MTRSAAAYGSLISSLLPEGDAWPREPGMPLAKLTDWMAAEFARVDARVADLLREADPRQTAELIEEWEREVGLPDECSAGLSTLEARRAAIVTRLTERLSPTPASGRRPRAASGRFPRTCAGTDRLPGEARRVGR